MQETMPRPGPCPGWQQTSQGYTVWEEEMYFALYHFKEPLHSTGCRTLAFTEDLKDLHLGMPTVSGSALQHSSQHALQHRSTMQGIQASLSLDSGKISAPPPREEGLLWFPRCLPTVATS